VFFSDRILTLDVGASSIVLAEFVADRTGPPTLVNYGIERLGVSEGESHAHETLVSAIRSIMRQRGIRPAPLYIAISGQAVFPRYVPLPPVSRDKVRQIVQYEAEQNVPFPIDEVVWDYQLIVDEDGEQSVMLVAAKTESVTRLTRSVQDAGLEPEVVDAAPMALYNVVRYNYPDLTGCTMVLDIGARASNLVFIEDQRIFSRSIPVAGNAVTQEIMKEFDIPFDEAEALKASVGFVALGGVYGGTNDDVAERVSKIVRNVVARLHAEVNRSINFYRGQQGGSAPNLVLLTGGGSVIEHMDTFFREKLRVDVEYLNPFINIPVGPDVDSESISRDITLLGEGAGLALRRALACPVEISLMPPDLVAAKVLQKRQPFFALAAVGLALVMLCWWMYFYRMRVMLGTRVQQVEARIADLTGLSSRLQDAIRHREAEQHKVDLLLGVAESRTQWIRTIEAVHDCLLEGMWLTRIEPVDAATDASGVITHIDIAGIGFDDRLQQVARPDATAIEVFRDKLRATDTFTDETEITMQPPTAGAFKHEFTIRLALREPIRTEPGAAQ
jgi:type IV pilus assembly protein PilM